MCMATMMRTVTGHTVTNIMEITIGHNKSNFKVACILKNMSGVSGISNNNWNGSGLNIWSWELDVVFKTFVSYFTL